jgi:ComF family protein
MYFKKCMHTIFPYACACCTCETDDLICNNCAGQLFKDKQKSPLTPVICNVCAHPLDIVTTNYINNNAKNICPACLNNNYVFVHTTALFLFNVQSKLILYAIKNGHINLLRYLSRLAAEKYKQNLNVLTLNKPDLIIPVPIHTKRLYQRGYQQTLYIAKIASKILNIPYTNFVAYIPNNIDNMQRKQKMLNREQRYQGLKWHIQQTEEAKYLIQHKHVLLVDDVMTTGATLNTLAELLLENGASSIQNLILARTPE